ncbi:class I SAM-dependent methyltransferase [Baaleninema simplex]|uniref:class I SAM-dependent methyltransferase n=1 Tax=Baaleninema simplex TaxID=2862350 RepID=UPI00034C79BB|nr:class I SAM-dependent methyltransferase [Baaleninema simplex]
MTDTLTKLTYQAFQQGKSYFGVAHKTLSTQIAKLVSPPPEDNTVPLSPEVLALLQRSIERLQEEDWQDAERGLYPTEILFDNPWLDFFQYYPLVWVDLPKIWERVDRKEYQRFDSDIDTVDYPKYYVQNFHHQTDGYLSDLSANLYDLQVELLFNGSADAMRRRVLAPLKQGLTHFSDVRPAQQRVLDVATGTGRTLRFLRNTLPKASLHGTDLSPAYLRKANQQLSELPGTLPQLCQANAENLPYRDDYFHAATCVFLFHELPPQARQNVIDQCYRVLKPGGTFVICDSIQKNDEPKFAPLLHNFPTIFHEPYYRSYTEDDMTARLEKAGFTDIETQVHFMSKYWIARKVMRS